MNNFIPTVISTEGRSERAYDLYSRLLRDRIIWVHGISQESANIINAQLLFLVSENDKLPIKMYINSPGGSIIAGDAVLDTMDYVKSLGITLETIVTGMAASFGSLILINGSEGHRLITPRSRVMIHQPRGGAQGTAADMEVEMKLMLEMRDDINQFVHEKTGQPIEWVEKHMDRDSWFKGQKAVDVGLADKVVVY